jgi:hypothetical protein
MLKPRTVEAKVPLADSGIGSNITFTKVNSELDIHMVPPDTTIDYGLLGPLPVSASHAQTENFVGLEAPLPWVQIAEGPYKSNHMNGLYFTIEKSILMTSVMVAPDVMARGTTIAMWRADAGVDDEQPMFEIDVPSHQNEDNNTSYLPIADFTSVQLSAGAYVIVCLASYPTDWNPTKSSKPPHQIFKKIQTFSKLADSVSYPSDVKKTDTFGTLINFAFQRTDQWEIQLPLPEATTAPTGGISGNLKWGKDTGIYYLYVCVAANTWKRIQMSNLVD